MKIKLSEVLIFSLFFLSFSTAAQTMKERIINDISLSYGSTRVYSPSDTTVTPPPAGYKPVYISHFGRHGSRFTTQSRDFFGYLDSLTRYAGQALLTPSAEEMLAELIRFRDTSLAHSGNLSARGAREHRQIARRMSAHYPEVFNDGRRKVVNVYSTDSKRVLESRDNFVSVLSACNKRLVFTYMVGSKNSDNSFREHVSGKREPDGYEQGLRDAGKSAAYKAACAEYGKESDINPDSLLASIFVSIPEKYKDKDNAFSLIDALYKTIRWTDCLDMNAPASHSFYRPDIAYGLWVIHNARWYYNSCRCPENMGYGWVGYVGATILSHIVAEADKALLKKSKTAADLRFSHDTMVLPLLAAIGIEGCSYEGTMGKAHEHIVCSELVSMAANLQMVFYESRKGPVLVKFMHNEKEISLDALSPVSRPYYLWSEVREYLLGRVLHR